MAKEKCDCGKMAVWLYMPGYSGGGNPHSCDECVMSPENKNGCSCNWNYAKPQEGLPTDLPEGIEGKDWRWVISKEDEGMGILTKEDGYWINLDEKGRPYPCVEYDYSEDGYDEPTLWDKIRYSNLFFWITRNYYNLKWKVKRWWKRHVIDEAPDNLDL
jgi:hypothetical protein